MGKLTDELGYSTYHFRKLSTGFISCMVASLMVVTPITTYAKNSSINTSISLTERKNKENIKNTLWIDGVSIKDSDFEHQNDNQVDYFIAEYGKGSGYFDVNKKYDQRDSLLCSGAVVTNMFHWWLNQNKSNIEKFKKQDSNNGSMIINNQKVTDLDQLNQFYKEYQHHNYADQSRFFDIIKSHFTNKALDPKQLIELYFNGFHYNSKYRYVVDKPAPNNLFYKVLKNKSLAGYEKIHGLDHFSKTVIDSLKSHKIIGIAHKILSNSYGHIITLWGADIDANNQVKAVYITDSDDRYDRLGNTKDRKVGMKRYIVNKDNEGNVHLTGQKNAANDSGVTVLSLYTLSRGDNEWAEYFKDHPEVKPSSPKKQEQQTTPDSSKKNEPSNPKENSVPSKPETKKVDPLVQPSKPEAKLPSKPISTPSKQPNVTISKPIAKPSKPSVTTPSRPTVNRTAAPRNTQKSYHRTKTRRVLRARSRRYSRVRSRRSSKRNLRIRTKRVSRLRNRRTSRVRTRRVRTVRRGRR